MIGEKISKGLIVLSTVILISTGSSAQSFYSAFPNSNPDPKDEYFTGERCASNIIHDRLMESDPVYRQQQENLELAINKFISENQDNRMPVLTIPVVVHVLHTGQPVGTGVNISDEQIFSAIEALNEDYRKMTGTNGDGNGVDVEIEFCLASRDPNGNPSNGISRVDASNVPLYATEGIGIGQGSGASETSVKAQSNWPQSAYYNIWIVNEIENNDGGAGIQGFAYFPNGSANDGAAILFNAFGTVGNLKSYTDLNRVATHEIGHGLNLYHTFQGGTCTENNCSIEGDKVCDTPPTNLNSNCNSPACSGTQNVENYMDYTSEDCQNMFSQGQKDRMRAALQIQRASLLTSLGCVPVTSVDCAITNIAQPSGLTCDLNVTPEVTITNYGSTTLTSASIKYHLDSNPDQTFIWTGSLASGFSETVILNELVGGVGVHTVHARTQNPNELADENSENDAWNSDYETIVGLGVSVSVTLDLYGSETTWEITDANNLTIVSGGPYTNGTNGLTITKEICLPAGCFDFKIYDAYGDGICCGYGSGSYQVTDENNIVLASGGQFATEQITNFCLTENNAPPVAAFESSAVQVCAGETINFNDLSSGNPESWNWNFVGASPSSSSVQNPGNVTYSTPGTYTVSLTVSNGNGSDVEQKTDYVVVNEKPTISANITNASCTNNDGVISLTVVGGSSPYDYHWSNNESTSEISNLSPGAYSVEVSDMNGCISSEAFTVEGANVIQIEMVSISNATCFGAGNGIVSIMANGGSPGYTYQWNDPLNQTTAEANNLTAGVYTVTVTDNTGCQQAESFEITEPNQIVVATENIQQPLCHGDSNGSITVSGSGGSGNLIFLWDNGFVGIQNSNLSPGLHEVYAIDANNCVSTEVSFLLVDPEPIEINLIAINNASCSGANDGFLNIDVTGGSGSYSYTWNDSQNQTTAQAQNLTSGSYQVIVSDENACTQTATYTIQEPSAINIELVSITNTSCANNDGMINTEVSGGSPGYTYYWSNGNTGPDLTNLSPGIYTLTVTDANGCSESESYTVNGSDAIQLTVDEITNISCNGMATGSISVLANGTTSGYTFLWNDFENQTTAIASNLIVGTYMVVVTDGNGCQQVGTYTLSEPDPISVIPIQIVQDSCELGVGSIEIDVFGGTPGYDISWNDPASTTGNYVENLFAGVYAATIVDMNNCVDQRMLEIGNEDCEVTGIGDIRNKPGLVIYPNPVSEGTVHLILPTSVNSLEVNLISVTGESVWNEHFQYVNEQVELNIGNPASGLYILSANYDGMLISRRVVIK